MAFADSSIAGDDGSDRIAVPCSHNSDFEGLYEDNFALRACYV